MNRALALAAGLVVVCGSLPACAAPPPDAAALYGAKCALCHGRDGVPSAAMASQKVRSFKDAEWQAARTDAQIKAAIEAGKRGTLMRGFKGELTPEQIGALVAHVRSFRPAPAAK